MLTRCPSCATTFRITPEQLKARQGRVRCGQCRNVFDALETLVEEATPAAVAATEAQQAIAPAIEPAPVAAVAVPPEPTFPPDPVEPAAPPPPAEPQAPPPVPLVRATSDASVDEPETLVDYEPAFDALLADAPPRRAWPWVLGTLFALAALALQAAYHFRVEIALRLPEAKPALLAACALAGCDLPLPRKIDLVAIESSDLHPDPANAARLQLVATLRNRAPHVQEYPHLELTLTDTADKALLRRVLAPADYLPRAKPAATGFAAGGDLPLGLTLEVKDLAAVGYRLYVFYP